MKMIPIKVKPKTREEFFADLARIRIEHINDEDLRNLIEEYECDKGNDLDSLAAALHDIYSNVTNGFLTEVNELLYDARVEIQGEVSDFYKCPCCGYKTLDEINEYDICRLCRWEDDGKGEKDIHKAGSPNRGSMAEYRSEMKENKNYYYREKYWK